MGMYCAKCGKEVTGRYCSRCGTPVDSKNNNKGEEVLLLGNYSKLAAVKGNCVFLQKCFMGQDLGREKSILISNIISVEVKMPGLLPGYIYFQTAAEVSKCNHSHKDDIREDNTVQLYGIPDYDIAMQMKEYIENYQGRSIVMNQVNTISEADEIEKFKRLLDHGVITQQEFEYKKKKLLGL